MRSGQAGRALAEVRRLDLALYRHARALAHTPDAERWARRYSRLGEHGAVWLVLPLMVAVVNLLGTAADVVDIYERDDGSLWSHYEPESKASAGPRARELVIGCLATVGNYDYRFQ